VESESGSSREGGGIQLSREPSSARCCFLCQCLLLPPSISNSRSLSPYVDDVVVVAVRVDYFGRRSSPTKSGIVPCEQQRRPTSHTLGTAAGWVVVWRRKILLLLASFRLVLWFFEHGVVSSVPVPYIVSFWGVSARSNIETINGKNVQYR
jgi:hypothetical protein